MMATDTTPQIRLRPTTLADLDFVIAAERHPDNEPYIGQWPKVRHEAAIVCDNEAHFIVEQALSPQASAPKSIGYVICRGVHNEHSALLLQRIVITQKGQGYGRKTLEQLKEFAFNTLGFHRLWFDVLASNQRARALYKRAGFVEEGILRDSWKSKTGYASMVIMSMLASEYPTNEQHR